MVHKTNFAKIIHRLVSSQCTLQQCAAVYTDLEHTTKDFASSTMSFSSQL